MLELHGSSGATPPTCTETVEPEMESIARILAQGGTGVTRLRFVGPGCGRGTCQWRRQSRGRGCRAARQSRPRRAKFARGQSTPRAPADEPRRRSSPKSAMPLSNAGVRTARGRADAKANGVKFGRKPKLTPHQKREAIKRRDKEGETLRSIGRSYNVSAATISRLMND
jgi:hypothetical protein